MDLPPLYEEEESDDGSQNWPNLTYTARASSRQYRVVWNAFILISIECIDLTKDIAEFVVCDTSSETNRSKSSKSRCIIQ